MGSVHVVAMGPGWDFWGFPPIPFLPGSALVLEMNMNLPRRVHARLVHGRSISYSLDGIQVRLRKGDAGWMPSEIYKRHSYKLELTQESFDAMATAAQREIPKETLIMPVAGSVVRSADPDPPEPTLPEWPLRSSPEEWLELHGDRDDLSPKMKQRLDLARKLVDGGS